MGRMYSDIPDGTWVALVLGAGEIKYIGKLTNQKNRSDSSLLELNPCYIKIEHNIPMQDPNTGMPVFKTISTVRSNSLNGKDREYSRSSLFPEDNFQCVLVLCEEEARECVSQASSQSPTAEPSRIAKPTMVFGGPPGNQRR